MTTRPSALFIYTGPISKLIRLSSLQIVAAMIAGMGLAAVRAQDKPPRSAKEGVYTTAQANQGKTAYDEKCASCHGTMQSTTPDMAPLMNDAGFQNLWRDRPLAMLFSRIRETMPQDKPNTLSPEETAAIIAYILSANQLPPGDVALPTDLEILKEIRLDAGEP